ncbi:MAG TPA: hypothetical protein VKU01_19440 [Bryobacteraceae bacterium]|nr:hypothetical protein [Bryobacteraceae bacterium]
MQHAVALQDCGLADGLRQVTLAGSTGAEKQGIFALADERAVARSNTMLRFIFGLKVKSNFSRLLSGS